MPRALPPHPSLEFDRKQAKSLLEALRAGDAEAMKRFREAHPRFHTASDPARLAKDAELNDAQLVIAREYGFASWRELSEKIVAMEMDRFRAALRKGDAAETRRLLVASRDLRERINEPIFDFGRRAIHAASANMALLEALLENGADINLRSEWEKGPFSVLDDCPEEIARVLVARGAKLTAHAAARLGWMDELRKILDGDARVVHEKGGDGQRPLHFARTIGVVDLLLARGAEIDARCVDHHSTAAQYALAERPEICAHLLKCGATPDIFMAARLGDAPLALGLIAGDPACLAARINGAGYGPVTPFNIYCWSLGWYYSPHEIAAKFGQPALYDLLWDRSPAKVRLLVALSRGDEGQAARVVGENPGILEELTPTDHQLLPLSMFYSRLDAVRLMLTMGFDPTARGADDGTVLHIASWHGNAEIVGRVLKEHRAKIDLEARDGNHGGTALGWAAHGSVHSWEKARGDFPAVIRMLVAAGADVGTTGNKTGIGMIQQAAGNAEIQALLRELGAH